MSVCEQTSPRSRQKELQRGAAQSVRLQGVSRVLGLLSGEAAVACLTVSSASVTPPFLLALQV